MQQRTKLTAGLRAGLTALTLATASLSSSLVLAPRPALAGPEERADALATIAKATATVEQLRSDANFPLYWADTLKASRAVLVVPSFYKAGFIFGGAYGNAVLLVRDASGAFSVPAFYRMMAGSVGFQIGAQEQSILFMIKTDKALKAIMEDRFKFGAGVNLAFASWGGGLEASTTSAAGADVIAFSHSAGAFGGGALEGAGLDPRIDWNRAVYGNGATSRTIVLDRRYQLAESAPLIASLNRAAENGPAFPASSAAPPPAAPVAATPAPAAAQSSYSANTHKEPPPPKAAPRAKVETESLSPVSSSASSSSSSSTSKNTSGNTSGPVRLIPADRNSLQ